MRVTAILASLFVAGCATAPPGLKLVQGDSGPTAWPHAGTTPRLEYVGELTGRENYAGDTAGAGQRVLRWLVGLAAGGHDTNDLLRPQSGAVTDDGRILVTDAGRQAVLVFDTHAGRVRAWRQADGVRGFVTPVGIDVSPTGATYVADADLGYVVRLGPDGRPAGTIGAGLLVRPTGLAVDDGGQRVYVADSAAHCVRVFDADGTHVATIGERGTRRGQFNGPTYLTLAGDRLYVTDTLNARVQVFSTDGRHLSSIGHRGVYVGHLVRPKGNTVDDDGNVYVVESYHDHLLVFDGSGRFLLPIGGTGHGNDRFFLPGGLWRDADGRIFVADTFNGRVVLYRYIGDPT